MGLKAYSFTRFSETGAEQDCYITFSHQNCAWADKSFNVTFEHFASQEEASRKIKRIGSDVAVPVESRKPFVLRLAGNDFLGQALQPITEENVGTPFLLLFSDRIWGMASNTPFISDFSTIDDDGNRVEVKKSLNDLDAELHEIELS